MIGLRDDQQMKARLVNFLNHATGQCGTGLLAKAVGQSMNPLLIDRIREQVESSHRRSYRGMSVGVRREVGVQASRDAG